MIYSRWGSTVEIKADCGKHSLREYFPLPVQLVRTQRDDSEIRYYFVHTLRADEGIPEIVEAIRHVPKVKLDESTFEKAVQQAL